MSSRLNGTLVNHFLMLNFLRADYQRMKLDRKSTRLNSSHVKRSRMPSSA